MIRRRLFPSFFGLAILALACRASAERAEVDFARDVKPILAQHCYACHGPDESEGGLSFTSRDGAFAELESGENAIVPKNIGKSALISRVVAEDESERMPPEGDPLSKKEIAILQTWIEQGAKWSEHWGFTPRRKSKPPVVASAAWNAHPIDRFIYKRISDAGLKPNELAGPRTLVRRATHDITGLPPTADQVAKFESDPSDEAYGLMLDKLLQSPHYGERWARHWLDLVRYAETNSFERDGAKPNAWKYRDYVIRSFNDDKPYDQFLQEQLAGDELDNVTPDSMTATGFYRLGIWDDEPADRLLQRYDELDDILTTISQGMLGITINCARCHDHKIDPISQVDYYSMISLLSDISPYDRGNNIRYDVSPPEVKAKIEGLRKEIEEADKQRREIEQSGIVKMSAEDQRKTEGREREKVLNEKLKDFLSLKDWKRRQQLKKKAADAKRLMQKLPTEHTVLGLAKTIADPPPTKVLYRGNPHVPRDAVEPRFPTLFEPPEPLIKKPASGRSTGRRLALAEWITSPENRMTARVMANRVWQFHFGRGIVRSSNNFGQLGTPPTHPELLDWLAGKLIEFDWKLKPLHKLIMTSRAYRMRSTPHDGGLAQDPDNDLFWRFNMRRLSAEEVRDSLLAVNGSLNRKMYGPSFYEKLSKEVLAGQSRPGNGWGNSSEEERNRRSIYIHVKRSLITPILSAFDFPEPDRSCEARFATLQPGQALSLLNSDFVHEQAGRLAKVVSETAGDDAEAQIRDAIKRVFARSATAEEVEDGKTLMHSVVKKHGQTKVEALRLYCLSLLNWNEFVFVD